MKPTRQAQVSMFIIIGLLLLLGVIISVTVFSDFLTYTPPEEQVASELETELQPLVAAVRSCQEQILEEAADELLRGGGYIDAQQAGLQATPPPTNNAVQLHAQATIPYWRYARAGVERTKKPPLSGPQPTSISSQLANYVDERLPDCVPWSDYSQYDIQVGTPTSLVTYSNEETRINTDWPVRVQTTLAVKEYDGFQAAVDAPVQRLYRLAEELTEATRSTKLIENRLLDWISIYGGLNNLPPIDGTMELTRNFEVYSVAQAREELDLVIARALSYIQLHGSKDSTLLFHEDESFNVLQINSLIPETTHTTTQTSFRAYNPSTTHTSTQTRLLINNNPAIAIPTLTRFNSPGPSSIIMSVLPPLVDNRFLYETTFPVIYELTHNGYTLQVAYQANIKNNQAATLTESTDLESTSICESPGGSPLSLEVNTNEPTTVTYTCGTTTCPVGTATDGSLQATLPACATGELQVYAENKYSQTHTLASSSDEPINLRATLYEPREIDVTYYTRRIALLPVDLDDDGFVYEPQLSEEEHLSDATIYLLRRGMPYVAVLEEGDTSAQLIPGEYDVLAIKLADEQLVIDEDVREEGSMLFGLIGGETVVLEEIVLDEAPLNFLQITDEQPGLQITPGTTSVDLIGARIVHSDIQEHEDLELLGHLTDIGADMPEAWRTR